jgi:hypothetical protein
VIRSPPPLLAPADDLAGAAAKKYGFNKASIDMTLSMNPRLFTKTTTRSDEGDHLPERSDERSRGPAA